DQDGPAGESSRTGGDRPVVATAETDPVPNDGDAADDPAIWVDEDDPSRSTVIGSDKQGGIGVYDLEGRELHYLPAGEINNVDLRPGFELGGDEVTLVAAGNQSDNTMALYRVDPVTRDLVDVAARPIEPSLEIYGSCLYRSPDSGGTFHFVNSKGGEIEQWELFGTDEGEVDARLVRQLELESQTEGCVADDELGRLYVGEEEQGIWRFAAEPDAGRGPELVDSTGEGGNLSADVEGLTIAYGRAGDGYLVASSQGEDAFALYRRDGDNRYVGTFSVEAGASADGVEGTDGIDVTTAGLGAAYPGGLFVAQDGSNGDERQNFKLVPWDTIAPEA
ncbi:MAG: phytase, partial [Actinomycetota bacterium]|nr:phytase [Actinomycetota bacterium]